jgi:hypothetical protein
VVVDAPALLKVKGVSDRVTIEAGDFFKTVPTGGDAYLLSHIIHDWNEDQCLRILGQCRKSINPKLDFGLFMRRERVHFPFGSRYGAEFLYCLGSAGT